MTDDDVVRRKKETYKSKIYNFFSFKSNELFEILFSFTHTLSSTQRPQYIFKEVNLDFKVLILT